MTNVCLVRKLLDEQEGSERVALRVHLLQTLYNHLHA